jgi:uncharacterized pyridoxal phosphate-containing UPF0001 family protein
MSGPSSREVFAGPGGIHEDPIETHGFEGTEMSLYMSHGFEPAVVEGSTMAHKGNARFGERPQ